MAKIKVTQVKSQIDRSKNQKLVLESLGLGKISKSVVHDDSPAILGMIRKVSHLVKIEKTEA